MDQGMRKKKTDLFRIWRPSSEAEEKERLKNFVFARERTTLRATAWLVALGSGRRLHPRSGNFQELLTSPMYRTVPRNSKT